MKANKRLAAAAKQTISSKDVGTIKATDFAPKEQKELKYGMGSKKYVPKVEKNERTWGKITAALAANGPMTLKDLQSACKYEDVVHTDFVGYMVRGGHLAPVVE